MPSVRSARIQTDRPVVGKRPKRANARLAKGNEPAVESPARVMQQNLDGAWCRPTVEPWSARRTLGFILLTCGAFWTAVAIAATHVL